MLDSGWGNLVDDWLDHSWYLGWFFEYRENIPLGLHIPRYYLYYCLIDNRM